MTYLRSVLFLLAVACTLTVARAQSVRTLLRELDSAGSDSMRSAVCYTISWLYWDKNPDSALLMANKSLAWAEKAHDKPGMALALLSKGVSYDLKEEYPDALNCHLQALRIAERLKLDGLTVKLYNDIGTVYDQLSNYKQARDYYLKAFRITKEKGDWHAMAALMANIAEVYKKSGAYDSALLFNNQALPIMESLHDSVVIATILLNTGDVYNKKGQPRKALGYFSRCSAIAASVHDEEDLTWAELAEAEAYQLENSYWPSIRKAEVALADARRRSFAHIIEECYEVLYTDYRHLRNFERALQYRNLEITWKDSLNSTENGKKIVGLQAGYELEKKQHQIELLNKDKMLQQQMIAGERQKHILLAAIALFFGMWALFLYKSNKEKERLNRQLRAQAAENNSWPD